jgi:protein MBA1
MKTSLKNNPSGRLIWQLHRVVEPVQVLSLRVTQGHFGEVEPKFGNRLLAHALVKFDTEQVSFHVVSSFTRVAC